MSPRGKRLLGVFAAPLIVASAMEVSAPALPALATSPVTITWYLTIEPEQDAWARQMIPLFEKTHPDIRVSLQLEPFSDYDTKLAALFASGNPPDIWTTWGSNGIGAYHARSMPLDLTPLMRKYHFQTTGIPKNLLSYSNFGGQQYGIPFDSLGTYIFYNKTLFKKAGLQDPPYSWNDKAWTVSKLIADAKAITKNGTNPTKAVWGLLGAQDNFGMSEMLLWGTPPFSPTKGFATKANLDSPVAQRTYTMWTNMMYKWHIEPSYSYQQTYGNGNAPALFNVNRIGMIWIGGWELATLTGAGAHAPQWGIAPVPWGTSDQAPTFTDVWMIAKESPHPDQAFQFIQFLTSKTAMDSYMSHTGYSPANSQYVPYWTHLYSKYVAPKNLAEVFNGAVSHGVECYCNELAGYGTLATAVQNGIVPVLDGHESVSAGLKQVEAAANQTLQQIKASHGA